MASDPSPSARRLSPGFRLRPVDAIDALAYLVVLGLCIQFFPSVLAESFLLALLTAIVLKLVMEGILRVKKAIHARARRASTATMRAGNIVLLVLLIPGSKFVVLEVVALLFGDAVQLGGFWSVTALIAALSRARAGVRAMFTRPDPARAI